MGPIYSISDFLDMIRRRVGLISLVFIVGCFLSLFWALGKPHTYRSSEVIQIEQPKIDSELAPTTVAGSSARRLQLIEQKLMSRDSLQGIIDRLNLYEDKTDWLPVEKIGLLRNTVSITGVAAVREGFADDGAIAVLTITAEMDNPEDAQAVAHEFANLTRELSAARRQEQTAETLAFFEQQESLLVRDIATLEEELAEFRRANDLSIQGSLDFRRTEIGSLNDSLLELDREIIAAELARNRIDRTQRESTVARAEADLDAQLDTLNTQRRLLADRREELSVSIETTPEVERALDNFERRMTQLQGQLGVISTRRNEAEVGFSLENAARGERLITIEEAVVPDYPITMSKKRRAVMGAAAAGVLGLMLAFLLELRRPVIRTARQMEREIGLLPVVAIPDTRGDKRNKRRTGLAQVWQERRDAGKRGRNARQARKT